MRNRGAVLLTLVFLLGCASPKTVHLGESAAGIDAPLDIVTVGQVNGVVLPVALAPQVLRQCSRATLGPGESYWMPSVRDIARLEAGIKSFVQQHPDPYGQNVWQDLDGFVRQYAGLVRDGRKTIYVNLFPADVFRAGNNLQEDWRRRAIVICDGGASILGVGYDVETGTFIHIAYNGIG
jgi:hypothetical protein